MDAMQAIKETFFQECEEQLGELETGLLTMEEGSADNEVVNAVFRAVHSIKGGAGAFKLHALVRFAHCFETTLDSIRNAVLTPTPTIMKSMLRASDVLADLVREARGDGQVDETRTAELAAELSAYVEQAGPADEPGVSPEAFADFGFQPVLLSLDSGDEEPTPVQTGYLVAFKPKPELYLKGNETTRLFRDLERHGRIEVDCDISSLPPLAELEPENSYLSWNVRIESEADIENITSVFEFVDDACDLEITALTASELTAADTTEANPASPAAEIDPSELAALQDAAAPDKASPVAEGREPNSPPTGSNEGKAAKAEASGGSSTQGTIRVDLDRVDRLINLVGELVINQAMLTQRVMEAGVIKGANVAAGLDDLEHLTREIQESVMAIRAQPVRPLFQRMSRIVREVADLTGKSVRLKTEGEATEVDRTVIERLADPLTHMIRNAVGHGLELSEVRLAAGKSAQGEVRLSAAHKSGRVVIEIADDGAGIDRPRVKSIAIKKGLISPDAVLTDSEIDNLLFLPGFSTAEVVSNISGRGVGMDVVKRSIQALGGRISIASRAGFGSTFTMSLPLTLAVLDGMVVKVADQTLVIPLTTILETLKPKLSDIFGLGPDAHVMGIRGGFTPLIDVALELGFRSTPCDPLNCVTLLIETEGGVRSALLVDAIQDQRQVVIKSLEANYGHVEGIAAATILGDGRIALILDADAIVSASHRNSMPTDSLLV
jgi:two-component system, chemotaxis family, sensor kinase CheA